MRLFIIYIFSILILGSCTLPGTQTEINANVTNVEMPHFSMNIPKNWKKNTELDMPNTKYWNIELSYISPDVKYGFSNNLVILSDDLKTPMTSKKYAELNQVQSTKKYLEYTKLKNDTILFSDEDDSQVYIFEARYNTTTPRMKFIQTAKVCGTKVYLLHIALSLDKDPGTYTDLLKSFACK
jgi:hypothetical protein